jgi:hypothetical protein
MHSRSQGQTLGRSRTWHGLDRSQDRRRGQSRNRRRTRPQTESESASDVESHSVSDSETDSELDTQCAIRVQYFEIIALSIFFPASKDNNDEYGCHCTPNDQLRVELGVQYEVESADGLGTGLGRKRRVELGVECGLEAHSNSELASESESESASTRICASRRIDSRTWSRARPRSRGHRLELRVGF